MKYQKGDLVKYKDDILIITGFVPYKDDLTYAELYYTYTNITTTIHYLKRGKYTEKYLDLMSEKVG